jgi:hypothetical protein
MFGTHLILGCCGIDRSLDAVPAVYWYNRFQTCLCASIAIFLVLWFTGFSFDDLRQDGTKKESIEIVSGPKTEEKHKLLDTPPKRHNDK